MRWSIKSGREVIVPLAAKYLDVSRAMRWTACEKMLASIFLERFLSAFNLNTLCRFGRVKSFVYSRHTGVPFSQLPSFPFHCYL